MAELGTPHPKRYPRSSCSLDLHTRTPTHTPTHTPPHTHTHTHTRTLTKHILQIYTQLCKTVAAIVVASQEFNRPSSLLDLSRRAYRETGIVIIVVIWELCGVKCSQAKPCKRTAENERKVWRKILGGIRGWKNGRWGILVPHPCYKLKHGTSSAVFLPTCL